MKPVAGVAAIAVMMGSLVSAGGVAHANRVNWNAVAECESDGNWSANTGNGAFGGLQIKKSTWRANGGVGNPANASRAEQIQVAKRILANQGPDAWPNCMSAAHSPGTPRVGSLTHFLTYLLNQAEDLVG